MKYIIDFDGINYKDIADREKSFGSVLLEVQNHFDGNHLVFENPNGNPIDSLDISDLGDAL